ncbi:HNH endonuclease signature motif containing protein [Pseudoclavibacter helvolus]|uniref:HNH endonuclease signature motif containing protein n=1 Tax=Pseudoclavibacter helvolus TaxID=255205 RepID=UPI0030B8A20F
MSLSRDGRSKTFAVHRLVLLAFVGPAPDAAVTCHSDGDRTHNSLSNLRWDTQAANCADRLEHGVWLEAIRKRVTGNCKRGHPLVDINSQLTDTTQGVMRTCRACVKARRYARQHRLPISQAIIDAAWLSVVSGRTIRVDRAA